MDSTARIQTLAVLLVAVFGWLCFDSGSLQGTVRSFLDPLPAEAAPEAAAKAPPAPMLVGRPDAVADCVPLPVLPPEPTGESARPAGADVPLADVSVQAAIPVDANSAVRVLGLTERQQAEFAQVLEDAARDLQDLRHRPNEEGVTWHLLGKRFSAENGTVGWNAASDLQAARAAFAMTRLRNAERTFAQAHAQLVERYLSVLRQRLDPEQQAAWDKCDAARLVDADGLAAPHEPRIGYMEPVALARPVDVLAE